MKFIPTGKNILLEKKAPEEMKQGSLIIPDAKPKIHMCLVCGVGEKVELSISEGDEVMIHPSAGLQIEFDDKAYVMVEEKNILGKVARCSNT